MPEHAIDIWDESTYSNEIIDILESNRTMIINYHKRDCEIESENLGRYLLKNEYGDRFYKLMDDIAKILENLSLRGFHYTRLTDTEVAEIQSHGVRLSTQGSLRDRVNRLEKEGAISSEISNEILLGSPFNHPAHKMARSKTFFLTSGPFPVSYDGVGEFLRYWGGEACYFHQRNENILRCLEKIGTPRVIELHIPLNAINSLLASLAAQKILDHFSFMNGSIKIVTHFDICCRMPLPPSSIQKIHTEGDALFSLIGKSYPETYAIIRDKYK